MLDLGIDVLTREGASITIGRRAVEPGNVLLLENVRLEGEDDGVLTTDWVRVTPMADAPGNITVTMAPEARLEAMIDGVDVPTVFILENQTFALTTNLITGAAGKPQVQLSADRLALRAGGAEHPLIRHLDIALDGLSFAFDADALTGSGTGDLSLASLIANYDILDPRGAKMTMQSRSERLDVKFAGANLQEGELDFEEFIGGGGFITASLLQGPSVTSFSSDSPEFPVTVDARSEDGRMDFALGAGGFDMGWTMGSVVYNIAPAPGALPIPPFEVKLGGTEARMTMPVMPTATPEPAVFRFSLTDLAAGDGLWSLFDPAKTIPREPWNIDIDLSAFVKLFQSLDKAEDGASPMDLGEISDVKVTAFNASGGGARLTASGAVDIDYSSPFPVPDGAINVDIVGVQTLAQALVGLGLIEQMHAGMVMGGIMAFSKPGEAPDTFSSLIEFRDGQVLANGAPMPIQ